MDIIKIEQLEVFAYHGCKEEEKINGQKFYVDANLYTDVVKTSGLSDDLEDTVNYSKVCKFINKFIEDSSPFWKKDIPYTAIGSVIGTHAGPNAVAAAFFIE